MKAIQDHYPLNFAHCYGCGPANPSGHHLKSYLLDDRTEARFTPDQRYSGGVPDNVYGGMVASLLDCHGTASAAAFAYRNRGRVMGVAGAPIRFVTASLQIDFRKPTPLGEELLITGTLKSLDGRKAYVSLSLSAQGVECAHGEMLAVELKT
jgi:acyl-coenzyme A thioesterase PaaI-like protein